MSAPQHAPNLALDELINERLARGESIVHMAFGESNLPLFPALQERLIEGASHTEYGPVAGRTSVRAAIAGYFERRALPTTADDVVVAPGSKPLLLAILTAEPGDLVVAAPCWVTYAPQAELLGRRVIKVPIAAEFGGVPDPELLGSSLDDAVRAGASPRFMILTAPDNPTGTTAPTWAIEKLCAIAHERGLIVITDEIYRDVIFDAATTPYVGAGELLADEVAVVTGLSKSLSLGGWRIGAARFPDTAWGVRTRRAVVGAASQIWSNASGPMQSVAEYAFSEPAELVAYRDACTRLHGVVARGVWQVLVDGGVSARYPTGGFYVYPDFAPFADALTERGVTSGVALQEYMLRDWGIATLSGSYCGDEPAALRLRLATSLIYGATQNERAETLAAADPLARPSVRAGLEQLAAMLAGLG